MENITRFGYLFLEPRGLPRGRFALDDAAFGGLPGFLVDLWAAWASSITACAAASLETGTLKGEEDT